MNGTISYDGKRLTKLTWWSSEDDDPYDQWQQDTKVALHIIYATPIQKQKFRQYIRQTKHRFGVYYDVVNALRPTFRPQDIQTVFKLYGKKDVLGGPDLVTELVQIFDNEQTRGGFIWLKKLHKKMRKAGLMK